MSYIDNSENQTRFTFNKLDYNIPNNHISHFIKKFVSKNFSYLDKKYEKKRGRPAFPKTSLLNLIIYGKYDNFKTEKEISDSCEYNIYYRYLSGGLIPSDRTLQRFIREHGKVFTIFLEKIVSYSKKKYDTNTFSIQGKIIDNDNDVDQTENINDFILDLIKLIRKYEKNNEIIREEYEISKDAIEIYENNKIHPKNKITKINNIYKTLKKSKKKSMFLASFDSLIDLNKNRLYPVEYKFSKREYKHKIISNINITSTIETDENKKKCEDIKNNIELLCIVYNLKSIEDIRSGKESYENLEKFMKFIQGEYPNIKFKIS